MWLCEYEQGLVITLAGRSSYEVVDKIENLRKSIIWKEACDAKLTVATCAYVALIIKNLN
jgi:hypothetical protein